MATSNDAVVEAAGEVNEEMAVEITSKAIEKAKAPDYFDRTGYKPTGRKSKAPPPPEFKGLSVIDLKVHGGHKTMRRLHLNLCHGNHDAATLYESILTPFISTVKGKPRVQNVRHGAYWWGHPISKWASEHGWNYDHTNYLLKLLAGWMLIEKRAAKTPVNMLQVRPMVAEGAAHIPGFPDSSNYRFDCEGKSLVWRASQTENCQSADWQKLPIGSLAEVASLNTKTLRTVVEGEEVKGVEPVPASPGTTTDHHPLVKAKPGKGNPKPQGSNPASPVPPAPSRLAIAQQWEEVTGQTLTPTEATMLQKATGSMYASHGDDYKTLMVRALTNWGSVKWAVDPRDSRSNNLDRPRVDYFVAHWPEAFKAVQGVNPAPRQAPAPKVIPAPQPTSPKPASAPRDQVTLDKHLGVLAHIAAIQKSKA